MTDKRDSLDFAKEPVHILFRRMFLPTLISMVSMVILNITDGAFVGHGVGSDALAAVNIVAPVFLIMAGIGLMFGIGSSVVASIHLSKDNIHAANINLTQGIMASGMLGILICVVILLFLEETCMLFGCSEQLMPLAKSYLRCIALMAPCNLLGMTAMFMVRLDGAPRFAMIVNCGMAAMNIVLDYLLIFPLQMGLEGAGIATSVSFSLGVVPIIIYLLRYNRKVNLYKIKTSRTSIELTMRNIGYQIKIGFSALVGEVAIAVVIVLGNYVFMRYLGEDGVAAYSVGCYCLPIVFMLGNAIVQSVQPIISYAYGADNNERLTTALKLALRTSAMFGFIGMAFISLGADIISTVFLPLGCKAQQLCVEGLPFFSPAFIIVAINIVMVGYMQSTERAQAATVSTILRGFVCAVPCFFLMPIFLGDAGLWLALPVAELLAMVFIVIMMMRGRKRCVTL